MWLLIIPKLCFQVGHNSVIALTLVGGIISIGFFNWLGVSITKYMSATTRFASSESSCPQ
jgi:hypothetical protein